MSISLSIRPVAHVRNSRVGLDDDHWWDVASVIALVPELSAESLSGLEDFSHVEVIFVFDRVSEDSIEYSARHPRGNEHWPRVGIFAQRGSPRPNRLGATIARIVKHDGRRLHVVGLDAIDGTPVVDLKPVMTEFLPREPVRQPWWATEVMKTYWQA